MTVTAERLDFGTNSVHKGEPLLAFSSLASLDRHRGFPRSRAGNRARVAVRSNRRNQRSSVRHDQNHYESGYRNIAFGSVGSSCGIGRFEYVSEQPIIGSILRARRVTSYLFPLRLPDPIRSVSARSLHLVVWREFYPPLGPQPQAYPAVARIAMVGYALNNRQRGSSGQLMTQTAKHAISTEFYRWRPVGGGCGLEIPAADSSSSPVSSAAAAIPPAPKSSHRHNGPCAR